MRIQFILHADFERPGIIEIWAKEKGFKIAIARPFAGDDLSKSDEFDWLILMGGPQSALDCMEIPYLRDEIELIGKAIAKDKTILGFCLGAQLIGEALGAKTEKSPHKEVGVYPIKLTDTGKKDPLLQKLPSEFEVMHWHNDMPGLTRESQVLATSLGCPRQIIRYDEKIYGFQCHPEPLLPNIKEMIAHCEADLSPSLYVQSKEKLLATDFAPMNEKMCLILNNLLLIEKNLMKA